MAESKRENILGYDVWIFNMKDLPEEERKHIKKTVRMIEAGRINELGWGPIHYGRPPLTHEELKLISVKLPVSLVEQVDKKTNNRSEFIRKAIYAALAQ